jgi:two-component system, LytTR family, response regulator
MKIKTAIIDDEIHCIETLAYDLKACHSNIIEIVFTARNGVEALKLINKYKPQLVFLDIEMSGLGGFDILEVLNNEEIKIVFTTAHSKYAIKAVGSKADGYLLKPILPDDLGQVVTKIYEEIEASAATRPPSISLSMQKLSVANNNGIDLIPFNDIIYCKADDNYTTFYLRSAEKIMASKTLKHFGEILPDNQFVRIHKSYIVNLLHLKKYLKTDGGIVIMENKISLPVSRVQKDNLLRLIHKGI